MSRIDSSPAVDVPPFRTMYWQRDNEGGALPGSVTRGGDLSTVCFDECFRDGQSDPCPSVSTIACCVGAIETLEQIGEVLGGDSIAFVGECEDEPIPFHPSPHLHCAL